MDSPLMKNKY